MRVGAAAAFSLLPREDASRLIVGLLALLAMVGVLLLAGFLAAKLIPGRRIPLVTDEGLYAHAKRLSGVYAMPDGNINAALTTWVPQSPVEKNIFVLQFFSGCNILPEVSGSGTNMSKLFSSFRCFIILRTMKVETKPV